MDNKYLIIIYLYFLCGFLNYITVILIGRFFKISFINKFFFSSVIYFLFFISLLTYIEIKIYNILFHIFFYINMTFITLVTIYTPISSIRFRILEILYKNNFRINKKKLHKLYNNSVIFHKRWNRLKNSKTIIITKKEVNIKTLKVKILLNFFFIIKKLFG